MDRSRCLLAPRPVTIEEATCILLDVPYDSQRRMSTPATASRSSAPRRRQVVLLCLVGPLILLAVGGYVTLFFGQVSGTEFSPESFDRRSFRYHEVPLLGWQVTPIKRDSATGTLETFLQQQDYFTAQAATRWDLIMATQRGQIIDPRGASILAPYLDANTPAAKSYWVDWSKQHPGHARWLWPEVVRLARRRLYVLIPDVMRLARARVRGASEEFYAELQTLLAQRSGELATAVESSDPRQAQQLKDWRDQYAAAAAEPPPAAVP